MDESIGTGLDKMIVVRTDTPLCEELDRLQTPSPWTRRILAGGLDPQTPEPYAVPIEPVKFTTQKKRNPGMNLFGPADRVYGYSRDLTVEKYHQQKAAEAAGGPPPRR